MKRDRTLTDEQLMAWLVDGFLVVEPEDLSEADHGFFHQRATDLYELSRATGSATSHLDELGDNLRARIPELDRLLGDPVVDGAVESLLGPDYLVHPHSFCHISSRRDQVFHQDGNLPWNERGHYRAHRPDWAVLFYYPQDVDERNGPTEVVPGSQYWTIDHETDDGRWHPGDRIDRSVDESIIDGDDLAARDRAQREGLDRGLGIPGLEQRFLRLRAGSVVIAHYDLVHRGSRTAGAQEPRYLYKFYVARTRPPPSVPTRGRGATPPAATLSRTRPGLKPVVLEHWSWATGGPDAHPVTDEGGYADPEVAVLGRQLLDGNEEEKVAAAYRLGRLARRDGGPGGSGPDALAALETGLGSGTESSRRASGHGLRVAGERGLAPLIRGAGSDRAVVRRPSVAGLGTARAARSTTALDTLVAALAGDPDDLVRSNAAYSLGQVARAPEADANRIAAALLDRLTPGAEPDNATNVGLTRSTVRQSAAYGLLQVLANHQPDDALIDWIVDGPLRDGDRYVQGLITEALARVGHLAPGARKRAMRYLSGRRWNPSPEPG